MTKRCKCGRPATVKTTLLPSGAVFSGCEFCTDDLMRGRDKARPVAIDRRPIRKAVADTLRAIDAGNGPHAARRAARAAFRPIVAWAGSFAARSHYVGMHPADWQRGEAYGVPVDVARKAPSYFPGSTDRAGRRVVWTRHPAQLALQFRAEFRALVRSIDLRAYPRPARKALAQFKTDARRVRVTSSRTLQSAAKRGRTFQGI